MNRGGPRDLGVLRDGLNAAEIIRAEILSKPHHNTLALLARPLATSPELSAFQQTLTDALTDNLPSLTRDGHFIRAGYFPAL
ncbi:hypothetical protein, partial [Bacillus sp. GbtcB14]|uniref:hypothetical protein n=1 Tax=Bacillus sp. GbtcB14 TaxID=2824759 RepID=UPI001C2F7AF8